MVTTPKSSTTRPKKPITPVSASKFESIVIVGTENHDWQMNSANKAMFMMQGIRRLKQYPKEHKLSVFLFEETYPADLLTSFKAAAKKYKAEVETLSSNADLVTKLKDHKENIKRIDIYAHGVVDYLLFGLHCSYEAQTQFTHRDAASLAPSWFAFDAEIYSYACRTALGNKKIDESDTVGGKKLDPYIKLSLAQTIANKAKRNTHAYVRRTDYVNTLGSSDDRKSWRHFYAENWSSDQAKSWLDKGPFSQERADALKSSIRRRKAAGGTYPFDPEGALNDVIAAPTPLGVTAAMLLFKPIAEK